MKSVTVLCRNEHRERRCCIDIVLARWAVRVGIRHSRRSSCYFLFPYGVLHLAKDLLHLTFSLPSNATSFGFHISCRLSEFALSPAYDVFHLALHFVFIHNGHSSSARRQPHKLRRRNS